MRRLAGYDEVAQVLHRLPDLVQEKRRRLGFSLRDAAQQAGVSFNSISRFERGEDIMLSNAVKLLAWVGAPTEDTP